VYVLKTYTPDGTVTDEKYGMNLLTDYGFTQYFGVDGTPSFPTNIYVGEGTSSFDKTTKTLVSVLFDGLAADVEDDTINHSYPLYFAPGDQNTNGRITTVSRYIRSEYAENIAGITSDVIITEYGIGSSCDNLWTHAFVYDNLGDRASITKRPGEILSIEVYLCCSFLESLIMNGYANDTYTVITTGHLMMNRMNIPTVSTFKRDTKTNRTISSTSRSAVVDSTITKTAIMETLTLVSSDTTNNYIDGFSCETTGFQSVQPQQLETPELVTTDSFRSRNPLDQSGFADCFGRDIPITQIDVTSVNSFNYKTNLWNNPLQYNNSSNHLYDEVVMSPVYAIPLRYTNNNALETLYLYQNINPSDPIIKIRGNVQTLYATDKYWQGLNFPGCDWIRILDRDNIPVGAQSKRYWLSNSNSINLEPMRQGTFYLKRTEQDEGYHDTPSAQSQLVSAYGFMSMDNLDYEISISYSRSWTNHNTTQLFSLRGNKVCTINKDGYIYTYGKWFMITDSTTLDFYDISGIDANPLPTPTYETTTVSTTGRLFTANDNGQLCISSYSSGNLVIVDFTTPTITITPMNNIRVGCFMWHTSRIAYINSDSTKLVIYDTSTSTQLYEFTLPQDLNTTIYYIMANTNHVVIMTTTQTFICDIRTGTFINSDAVIHIETSRAPAVMCFTDMIVTYGNRVFGYNEHFSGTVLMDTPVIRNLSKDNLMPSGSRYGLSGTRPQLLGDTILLASYIYSSSDYSNPNERYVRCIDFGYYMRTGTYSYKEYKTENASKTYQYDDYIIHEGKMLPAINCLPIKITGNTKTISSLNNSKSIRNKQFNVSFSNAPTFSGKPPGSLN
jgi:hypothetical protein